MTAYRAFNGWAYLIAYVVLVVAISLFGVASGPGLHSPRAFSADLLALVLSYGVALVCFGAVLEAMRHVRELDGDVDASGAAASKPAETEPTPLRSVRTQS